MTDTACEVTRAAELRLVVGSLDMDGQGVYQTRKPKKDIPCIMTPSPLWTPYQNLDKAGTDADYGPFVKQLAQLVERSFDLLGIA